MSEVKKVNVFARLAGRFVRFVREMRSELKKVVWPTRKQVVNNSIIVLICVAVMGTLTFALDTVLGIAVRELIGLFPG
jgi:preprotein translocase subunit SecE